MKILRLKHRKSTFLLSITFTLIHWAYVDLSYEGSHIALMLRMALFFLCAFLMLAAMFHISDRICSRQDYTAVVYSKHIGRYGFFISFFTLLFFWGIYYLICFPGNMDWDAGTCLLYGLGIKTTNTNNPYFQTILVANAYRFGKLLGNPIIGIGIYCFLQYITYIILISYALYVIGKRSMPAQLVLTIWYSLVPAFPIYALTITKDTNFAAAILAYVCLSFEMVGDPGKFFQKKWKFILLAVSILLTGLLRNLAVFVPVAAGSLYLIFVWKAKRGKQFAAILCAAAIFVCSILPRLLGVPGGNIKESLSLPIQQTGYYVTTYPEEVTRKEFRQIAGVVPMKYVRKYNPSIADPIKVAFKKEPTAGQLAGYFSAWASQFRKHPLAYGRAFYLLTYGYYTPFADLSDIKRHSFVGFKIKTEVYENTDLPKNQNEYLRLARKLDLISIRIPFYEIFPKIGLYAWILAFCIALLLHRKQYVSFVYFAPAIMVFIGCLFSPVNGYYRYAFPMIICVPVLLGYCLFSVDS